MSGGGGKGGKQTTEVQIPQYLQDASKRNIARAEQVQRLGLRLIQGPQVAAFNPTQLAAMQSNIGAAEAFGLMQPNTVHCKRKECQHRKHLQTDRKDIHRCRCTIKR